MEIYTIGFTKKPAARFFGLLRGAGVERVVDVRLNNRSQLAGFAKKDDLEFLLQELCNADYVHEPRLAPTSEDLKAYRSEQISWETYESRFDHLMRERAIEEMDWDRLLDRPTALLCSEPTPERCHRRLVVEHLQDHGYEIDVVHL